MKKLLAMLLTLVMLLSCMSVTAFAGTDVKCVTFTLSDYVDDSTPMSIASVTVDPNSVSVKTQKFRWFYCISGDSSYVNYVKDGVLTGWQKIEFDTEPKLSTGTPDLNNGALFAIVSIDLDNGDKGFGDDFVLKYDNREIPLVSTFIKREDYESDEEYETAYYSYTYTPTDEFWTWEEDEISACVKIFDTASESSTKSGSTTITATVAKPEVEYEIVIPQAVTMNAAGVIPIGAAKINTEEGKLKYATANTVISYTASGTNFTLKDGDATMPATYYSLYEKDATAILDTTKSFEVYKNSALVDPLTTLYVGVTESDWDTAAQNNPGTYTATVTYNFSAEEVEAKTVSLAEALVVGAQYNLKFHYMLSDISATYTKTADGFELSELLDSQNEDTSYLATMLSSTVDGSKIKFVFGEAFTITVDTSTNKYVISGLYPSDVTFISFSVKPAGAEEFTEITLTPASV